VYIRIVRDRRSITLKFRIEIYRAELGTSETVLHKTSYEAISPASVRKQALLLLRNWRKKSATGVRVLNHQNQLIYTQAE
jgi:hypothetical protein